MTEKQIEVLDWAVSILFMGVCIALCLWITGCSSAAPVPITPTTHAAPYYDCDHSFRDMQAEDDAGDGGER